ncbi:hypothetical protein [Legionella jamestowniensis]|uniref:Uncharacterized protein n=1 Tax=Legionella jamestowniensis TaxID=455 RepID=A0A0W0UFP5_9GAMM|nr:hypothetical protein [Legionella jamestowniensis]KTD06747.1 hypothetical protein Ljam_0942 [Legionella jamestowniensis]SFL83822.1 hypothetical protein SAMN02746073_2170 [Legionella jamestowniensis DSM 19215]
MPDMQKPDMQKVIEEFRKGFQYLDGTKHRRSRCYEFWYKSDLLRQNFTNVKLTAEIEKAVENFNTQLDSLIQNKGKHDFVEHKQDFLTCLAELLNTVQEKRFKYGKEATHTFMHHNQSIFERVLIPKGSSFLEQNVVNGLNSISNEYPELKNKMDEMIGKIQAGTPPYVRLHESMTIYADGSRFFSASGHESTLKDHLENVALKLNR